MCREVELSSFAHRGAYYGSWLITTGDKFEMIEIVVLFKLQSTTNKPIHCSLGCVHDGDKGPIRGAPGAADCKWVDGYIMGNAMHPQHKYLYSSCCVKSIHYVLRYGVFSTHF